MKNHKKNNQLFVLFIFPLLQVIFLAFLWYFNYVSYIGEILISVFPILIALSIIIDILYFGILYRIGLIPRQISIISLVILAVTYTILQLPVLDFYYTNNTHIFRTATDNVNNVSGSSLKLMSLNIYFGNKDLSGFIAAVKANNPDVIMLYELTAAQYTQLKSDIGRDYPYNYYAPSPLDGAFSKFPITSSQKTEYENDIGYINVLINAGSQSYSIYGIHPPAILSDRYTQLRYRYIDALTTDISRDTAKNIIIAGDYNMVPWVSGYKYLINHLPTGYYNIGSGRGSYNTWSPFYVSDLPVSIIDHIIVSPNLNTTDFQNIWIKGTDHHALITVLRSI